MAKTVAAAVVVLGAFGASGPTYAATSTQTAQPLPPSGTVTAVTESQPFASGSGDIADDPAIWVNPTDASRSVAIGSKKSATGGGLGVYNLDGTQHQFLAAGELNNVAVKSGVLDGRVYVVASERGANTLKFFRLDPSTRLLSDAGSFPVGFEPYGTCFYTSPATGDLYAFVTQATSSATADGQLDQYRLSLSSTGSVTGTKVRDLTTESQAEGCVADDAARALFLSVEDVGLFKYGAEPAAGATRSKVAAVGTNGLAADVEGVSIAYGRGSDPGYIVVSSQGNSTYKVYDLASPHAFRKSFSVGASATVDAVTSTDGLDVTRADLGAQFPQGLLVVHDSSNSGQATSNFKFVDAGDVLGDYLTITAP